MDLVPGSWSADATGATSSSEVWDSVTTLDGDPVHGTLAKSLHEGGPCISAPWRFVTVKDPGSAGEVAIDFNRTLNYPMAFSFHAVCPAPVPGNRLEVPVHAGELMPR